MKTTIGFCLIILVMVFCSKCTSSSQQNSFNDLASEEQWKPDEIMKTLNIQEGWSIGDLGAGGGYFTYRFAESTGKNGKVYAADINPDFLKGIEDTAKEKGLQNIVTVLSTEDDSKFENGSLDLVFIRNTFHHFENKGMYLKKLITKLKEDGSIVIIDYKEGASFWLFGHDVSRDEILSAAKSANLKIENEYDFLENQYFFVLKKQ